MGILHVTVSFDLPGFSRKSAKDLDREGLLTAIASGIEFPNENLWAAQNIELDSAEYIPNANDEPYRVVPAGALWKVVDTRENRVAFGADLQIRCERVAELLNEMES